MFFVLLFNLLSIRKKYVNLEKNDAVCNPALGLFIPPCPSGYGITRNCIMCSKCVYRVSNVCKSYSSYQSCTDVCAKIK